MVYLSIYMLIKIVLWTLKKKNIEHGNKTLNSDHKPSHGDKLQKFNPQ